MKILITGATGLVGHVIGEKLARQHQVFVLSRNRAKAENSKTFPCEVIEGDLTKGPLQNLPDLDAVIHLMGEPVIGRWTEEKKRKIYDSRVVSTKNLASSLRNKNIHLLSASAIGIYSEGEEAKTESSPAGQGFLADVCTDWEKEAQSVSDHVAIVRISLVLSKNGGALEKMLPPFKLGVGGPLGSGEQWNSWIHIDDLANIFIWALDNKKTGVFNAAAPDVLRNKDFSKILAKVLNRPLGPKVPKLALKLIFGEAASVMLASQKVVPERLLKEGFKFQFADLSKALENILKN